MGKSLSKQKKLLDKINDKFRKGKRKKKRKRAMAVDEYGGFDKKMFERENRPKISELFLTFNYKKVQKEEVKFPNEPSYYFTFENRIFFVSPETKKLYRFIAEEEIGEDLAKIPKTRLILEKIVDLKNFLKKFQVHFPFFVGRLEFGNQL